MQATNLSFTHTHTHTHTHRVYINLLNDYNGFYFRFYQIISKKKIKNNKIQINTNRILIFKKIYINFIKNSWYL